MRVLFVSSEAYPLAKTGGLADVSAALPHALAELGVDVRLVLPGYPCALDAAAHKIVEQELPRAAGGGTQRGSFEPACPIVGFRFGWSTLLLCSTEEAGSTKTTTAPIGPTTRNGLPISAR